MESLAGKTARASELGSVSTRRQRIAQLARRSPQMVFTSLAHNIDIHWMYEAYQQTRKSGAPGVDGQTAQQYRTDLRARLSELIDRAKTGTYRAPPVRRVEIPKGGGKTRPIGIPTLEDKILQRAVSMVLEPLYEEDFLDFSFGFRPGRSAHQARKYLDGELRRKNLQWIVEVDIVGFFDAVDRKLLQEIVRKRVCDGVLVRLIGKWLRAGVQRDGSVSYPQRGTQQGGVISPLLANIYLHEVLDTWFVAEVAPRLRGRSSIVRYADDVVCGFSSESEARAFMDALRTRFGQYGLALHPEKSRLVRFHRPSGGHGATSRGDPAGPGHFDFLGFRFHWGQSRRGHPMIKQKTAPDRFRRSLRQINDWCRAFRHREVRWQHQQLQQRLRGHYQYYGVGGNMRSLSRFRDAVKRAWYTWLRRRNQKRHLTWEAFELLHARYPLLRPYIAHPYGT